MSGAGRGGEGRGEGASSTLISAISTLGVFMLFGFFTLVALSYFIRKVPETKAAACSNRSTT
jgi:hypothetical protein